MTQKLLRIEWLRSTQYTSVEVLKNAMIGYLSAINPGKRASNLHERLSFPVRLKEVPTTLTTDMTAGLQELGKNKLLRRLLRFREDLWNSSPCGRVGPGAEVCFASPLAYTRNEYNPAWGWVCCRSMHVESTVANVQRTDSGPTFIH